jgi:hypothetical protein
LKDASFRELALLVLPLAIVAAAGVWFLARFVQPAPPKVVVMSTGAPDGAYHAFAASVAIGVGAGNAYGEIVVVSDPALVLAAEPLMFAFQPQRPQLRILTNDWVRHRWCPLVDERRC